MDAAMKTVTLEAAKNDLGRLVDDAARGEEIIIARAGRPVARLVTLSPAAASEPRTLGRLAGRIRVPDDFDHPLPDHILDAFTGH